MHSRGTNKQTKSQHSKSGNKAVASRSAFERSLADIEEGRLCVKRLRVAFIYEPRIEERAHKGRKRSLRDANDSDDGREMGLNKYPPTTPPKF